MSEIHSKRVLQKHVISICLLLSLLLVCGCAQWAQRLALINCNYDFLDIVPVEAGLTSMDLRLSIQIENPNPMAVVLDRLGFDFFVNEGRIFTGTIEDRLNIPGNTASRLDHILSISYVEVGTALVRAIQNRKVAYRLTGKAHYDTPVGRLVFPVDIVKGKVRKP